MFLPPYEQSILSCDWSKTFYSLVVDETTDRGTDKSLVIILKYKHPYTQTVKEESLGILEVEDASSLGQKTLNMNYLKKLGIPLNQMIGIGFDNAFVNMGARTGLGALLTAGIFASHASKQLPEGLEPMLRDFINYVANSPERIV
ncbi:hypothetical protein QYM36_003770 [Artemia franciscana]|uniref:DUF4371 domain-containing protein n=1 Tax=Artemia franciscana TaxID=6661 RepID=A0AA88L928_ARTSF|nr:hypothetical protein QYM36_003770 [Artemia franciscana]